MCVHSSVMTPRTCAVCTGLVRATSGIAATAKRSIVPKPKAAVVGTPQLSAVLGIPAGKPQTVEVCSFCRGPLDERTLTRGIGKPRKIVRQEQVTQEDGTITLEDVIIHVSTKVVACPDCVLNIKPIYSRCKMCKGKTDAEIADCRYCKGTKEGEKVSNGIKFRETPG